VARRQSAELDQPFGDAAPRPVFARGWRRQHFCRLAGVGALLVDGDDAGGDASAIEEVGGQADVSGVSACETDLAG